MNDASAPTTHQKAFRINLDQAPHGTFAEIGAGQEVAHWFFRVGGAASTVAKTISAYDMVVSDAIYGPSPRYVSRQRLSAMLDREYALLEERLAEKRAEKTAFFVFADTVASRSYSRRQDGHGWVGIRFQHEPKVEPSQILIHVDLLDLENVREQEALGVLGVNLIHGAYYGRPDLARLIGSLRDGLNPGRIEIDMARFSGPCFAQTDNRLMGLELVRRKFTPATVFTSDGEVVHVSPLPSSSSGPTPTLFRRFSDRISRIRRPSHPPGLCGRLPGRAPSRSKPTWVVRRNFCVV